MQEILHTIRIKSYQTIKPKQATKYIKRDKSASLDVPDYFIYYPS